MDAVGGAVAKSFRVLEILSTTAGPSRLSSLADASGMQKSTVHRVLAELIDLGYAEQDETTGLYRPTLRTWELGSATVANLPIRQVASAALQDLRRDTGETVSLVVRSGDDALYLDKIISPRPERFSTRVGSRVPLPLTIGGLALLASSDDGADVVRRTARRTDLSAEVDVDAVVRSLDTIRRRGHATSTRQGVTGVAAAVLDRNEVPVAALVVSAPSDRMNAEQRRRVTELLVSATARLGESLGSTTRVSIGV